MDRFNWKFGYLFVGRANLKLVSLFVEMSDWMVIKSDEDFWMTSHSTLNFEIYLK